MATQCRSVPERTRFIERMRSTFPRDWPSGSPAQIQAQVDGLTRQCRDLTQCYQTEGLLASQASAMGMDPGAKERELESHLMLEGMERMAVDRRERAGKVKQECEAWDRWRPEGGRQWPRGPRGDSPSLPATLTYSTEEELRELERLTLRVALLEQERHLQQALSDTLSPHLSSMLSGPDHPSLLRDVYSLLAEGGERFPALVLDTESD
ncbi:tubulin epsilon and delta complex protein 2-like [Aplochiton taeniatus]